MTAKKYFGTDGIRGKANQFPITADMALKLGQAMAYKLNQSGEGKKRAVIGRDTRISGKMLESALAAGFTSMGVDVEILGVMPTPAVAQITKYVRADLGVMITASHNPYTDNGIKFFGPDGYKFSDDFELEVESLIEKDLSDKLTDVSNIGKVIRLENVVMHYMDNLKASASGIDLSGLKIVLDCANGAASDIAPKVLREMGANVTVIFNEPDGLNINKDCGATHTEALRKKVVELGADIGFALDGDADRLIVSDEQGNLVDGDQIIALVAKSFKEQGKLKGDAVVTTIMSNMGMESMLADMGIRMYRAKVGDRYVVEDMRKYNLNVGGEQSGHIVLNDYSTTGDGLMSAIQVLRVLSSAKGQKSSVVCSVFTPMPQLMENYRYSDSFSTESAEFKEAVSKAEEKLGKTGRVIIRKSGTEPVIRIMVECNDDNLVKDIVKTLGNFVH